MSSKERLHVLRGLLYILGWASPSLRQFLMQALQEWLATEPVAAENMPHNHQGMDAQMLVLGGEPHCMYSYVSILFIFYPMVYQQRVYLLPENA